MNRLRTRLFANGDFTMLSRLAYLQTLTGDIQRTKRGDRVIVSSMVFDPKQAPVAELLTALTHAAQRGVDVHLLIDSYLFLINDVTKIPGPLWFNPNLDRPIRRRIFEEKLAALKTFAAHGGHYTITNQPRQSFSLPHGGRSHIKAAVVNDTVYVGGCNLIHPHEVDIMLQWDDKRTAAWLYDLLLRVAHSGDVRSILEDTDQEFSLDATTRLLVDAGVPGQSLIFEEALGMIDNAREWVVLTNQYFPPGVTAQALIRAIERGVDVRFIYSHPSMHGIVEGIVHHVAQWRERRRLPAHLFQHRLPKHQHLHAKLLATEQGAIVGSHNYAELGVKLGTAELALRRDNPAFAKQAVVFIEQQLKRLEPIRK